MKRFSLYFIFLFLILLQIHAEKFEKYDFTFYKTVDDSIAILNDERFGFDYTGYGFLGEDMTTGLYIRFGMQTSYTSLISLFERDKESDSDSTTYVDTSSSTKSSDTNSSTNNMEFVFSFAIGPAFRHLISDSVMWYMGIGVNGKLKDTTSSVTGSDSVITSIELKVGTDLDMGFRLDLAENTSFRIGFHMATALLTYSNVSISGGSSTVSSTTQKITADVFTKIGEKSATDFTGYIGLAHVFKPKDISKYKYSNKTRKLGGGTLVEV